MDELQHWGILGMKWGQRRFRNYDGTLTKSGKERYNDKYAVNDMNKAFQKKKVSDKQIDSLSRSSRETARSLQAISDMLKSDGPKKKLDLSRLSNYDLEKKINRERLERDYNELFSDYANPKVQAGKEIASKILNISSKAIGLTGGAVAIALAIKQLKDG